jgi:hypothetical protein
MLGLRLGLGLLLGLGCLLRCLLLSILLGHPLLASAAYRSHGGANGRAFSSIAGDRPDCGTSDSAPGGTLHRSTFAHVLLGLLRSLLLGGLLLLRTRTCRSRSLRIDTAVLLCRTIAIALVLELLVGILLALRIDKHADTLCGRPRWCWSTLSDGTAYHPCDQYDHQETSHVIYPRAPRSPHLADTLDVLPESSQDAARRFVQGSAPCSPPEGQRATVKNDSREAKQSNSK